MRGLHRVLTARHTVPILLLVMLCLIYWGKVLFTGQALLPGAMLGGFAPFGNRPEADWNILQWDALGQYYPWRVFAARELQSGHIPLWNPHQFSGAPFVANGQSAVFYPLNFVFWLVLFSGTPAYAFGLSAFLHTLLAALSTYFLAQRWKLSRASSLLAATVFAFCGYLAAWVMLPTLANTASWLPMCLLLFERAAFRGGETERQEDRKTRAFFSLSALLAVSLSLACALLAGHAQIFFYILVALFLRALFLPRPMRALSTLLTAFVFSLMLSAMQLLPTLELARNGHRAGVKPTAEGWSFLVSRALQTADLPSLMLPLPPSFSFSENFGYVGTGVLALSVIAVVALCIRRSGARIVGGFGVRCWMFALALALFGVLYATATPLAQGFYYVVPGLPQMGGVGRALVLWSLGAALLAAFGLDALRHKWSTLALPILALSLVTGELFFASWNMQPTAPRQTIYPTTQLTTWLQAHTRDGARVLFLTPRNSWLPSEVLQQGGRNHPPGLLPPNGAMVYGLYDVNGYDSLAPRAYRDFLVRGEGEDVSPQLNGNMILLNNPNSPALDELSVRYVVSQTPLESPRLKEVLRADGGIVYERKLPVQRMAIRNGKDFSPGWRDGQYQPESFRLGTFVSLCALLLSAFMMAGHFVKMKQERL